MDKIDGEKIKQQIIEIIRKRGPCLPIHISREIKLNTIFSSAFLSELVRNGIIRISNLKVGGSPLYYLHGQEEQLEKFYNYLPTKEREAFLLLKAKKILKDSEQEPAIRVALRNIKDFAYPIKIKIQDREEIFWCYFKLAKEDAKKLIEERFFKKTGEEVKSRIDKKTIIKKQEKATKQATLEKPIIKIKEHRKKEKPDSDFVRKIKEKLENADIEILKEIYKSKKEAQFIVRTDSKIGKISFYCVAKDKKNISDNDLAISLQKAQELRFPLLFITDGKLNKKAEKYLEDWKNLIKLRKIKELHELYS